jgi:hypothetical protein
MVDPSKMEWACGFLNQQLLGGKIGDYGEECGIKSGKFLSKCTKMSCR